MKYTIILNGIAIGYYFNDKDTAELWGKINIRDCMNWHVAPFQP